MKESSKTIENFHAELLVRGTELLNVLLKIYPNNQINDFDQIQEVYLLVDKYKEWCSDLYDFLDTYPYRYRLEYKINVPDRVTGFILLISQDPQCVFEEEFPKLEFINAFCDSIKAKQDLLNTVDLSSYLSQKLIKNSSQTSEDVLIVDYKGIFTRGQFLKALPGTHILEYALIRDRGTYESRRIHRDEIWDYLCHISNKSHFKSPIKPRPDPSNILLSAQEKNRILGPYKKSLDRYIDNINNQLRSQFVGLITNDIFKAEAGHAGFIVFNNE